MEHYEIIVEHHVDRKRIKDFEGLDYIHLPNGNTLLFGYLKDQPELFSVLNKIRDMNLMLVSVKKERGRKI